MNGILDRLRSRSGNKRIRAEPEPRSPRGGDQALQGPEVASNEVLPDIPQERHDQGSGDGATERDVQRQSEGSSDMSGEAPRLGQSSLVTDKQPNFKSTCFQCETDPYLFLLD